MTSSRILTATRLVTTTRVTSSSTRVFSSGCAPAIQLRGIVSEYRKENFSQEIPPHFKKELIRQYVGVNGEPLENVGHEQDTMTSSRIHSATPSLTTTHVTSSTRLFSTECAPAIKLRGIISESRKENFSREIPPRFKKELIRQYVGVHGEPLKNVGHAQDLRMTSPRILSATRSYTTFRVTSAKRLFSSECAPVIKLRGILSEYRKENFSREIPPRFKKELLRPYVGANGAVEIEDVNKLLKNIGHAQDLLSSEEQRVLLEEAGSQNRFITISKMMELIE